MLLKLSVCCGFWILYHELISYQDHIFEITQYLQ